MSHQGGRRQGDNATINSQVFQSPCRLSYSKLHEGGSCVYIFNIIRYTDNLLGFSKI